MIKFYYKHEGMDEVSEFEVDEWARHNKQTIAEEAVCFAFDGGMNNSWFDGDTVDVKIYDEGKNFWFNAEVSITIPEPEFQASIK